MTSVFAFSSIFELAALPMVWQGFVGLVSTLAPAFFFALKLGLSGAAWVRCDVSVA